MQFVEISIEKFVRQIKKVKVHSPQQLKFRERLSDDEAALLEKYFLPSETIKPSLVAFPYFQAYPSRVHKVMHSSRTGWLIDAMQLLQGLSFSDNGRKFGCDVCLQLCPFWNTHSTISPLSCMFYLSSSHCSFLGEPNAYRRVLKITLKVDKVIHFKLKYFTSTYKECQIPSQVRK